MLYLEVETRAGTQRIPLVGQRMSIGRLSYNDVVIDDSQISRQHAELRHVDGEWWIADLKSTNGIHLGSRRVPVHKLATGDMLLLAPDVRLRVVDDGPASASAGPTAGRARAGAMTSLPPGGAPFAPQTSPPTVRAQGSQRHDSPNASGPWPRDGGTRDRGAPVGAAPFARSQPGTFATSNHDGARGPAERAPAARRNTASSGPMPQGPFNVGGETDDPFRRSLADAAVRPNLVPAQSLLHVCQTCGQLTAPDVVYCQSCHHSIAYGCAHCGLSLLPIQDRCPRCQATNPASVRRAHRIPS